MAKLTKRMRVIREKVDATKQYDINEAIALLKELATAKFTESVDVAVNLGIDARKSDQNVRGATVLPHGTGPVSYTHLDVYKRQSTSRPYVTGALMCLLCRARVTAGRSLFIY